MSATQLLLYTLLCSNKNIWFAVGSKCLWCAITHLLLNKKKTFCNEKIQAQLILAVINIFGIDSIALGVCVCTSQIISTVDVVRFTDKFPFTHSDNKNVQLQRLHKRKNERHQQRNSMLIRFNMLFHSWLVALQSCRFVWFVSFYVTDAWAPALGCLSKDRLCNQWIW